jgi:hypothetical protein
MRTRTTKPGDTCPGCHCIAWGGETWRVMMAGVWCDVCVPDEFEASVSEGYHLHCLSPGLACSQVSDHTESTADC